MTDDVVYIDPYAPEPVQGMDGMRSLTEKFRLRFDHKLIAEGDIDAHHNVFRRAGGNQVQQIQVKEFGAEVLFNPTAPPITAGDVNLVQLSADNEASDSNLLILFS